MNIRENMTMADVQGAPDNRHIAISRVGIRRLRHPISVCSANGHIQHTVAVCDLAVRLPAEKRGTHMSRFVALMNEHAEPLSATTFSVWVREMLMRLDADTGSIEITFPYFVEKRAPVSDVASLMDYQVSLSGTAKGNKVSTVIKVVIPVTSLCPCSKEISAYGAHNQRSHVTITAHFESGIWIEDLLRIAEEQASSQLYGLLKRPDEKFVTERAYDNPKFCEDLVRDVAIALATDNRISAHRVEVENFESIHNHSAYACIDSSTI